MNLSAHVRRSLKEDSESPVNTKELRILLNILTEVGENTRVEHFVNVEQEPCIGGYLKLMFANEEYKLVGGWFKKETTDLITAYSFLNAISAAITISGEEVFKTKKKTVRKTDTKSSWLKIINRNESDPKASFHKKNTLENLGYVIIYKKSNELVPKNYNKKEKPTYYTTHYNGFIPRKIKYSDIIITLE